MKYCRNCGKPMEEDAKFCAACGQSVDGAVAASAKENWFDKATRTINGFMGGNGSVRPPLKKIFGGVFEKHSKADSEEIFICGTTHTTPELGEDGKLWPRTWLWSRILLAFVAAFGLLHLCCSSFHNTNTYPGLMVIGSFMVPLAMLVFFFELNTPRNISFFNIIKYFLVGGCASLVVTLLLFDFFSMELNKWLSATLIGVIEEVGKLAIVAFVIWRDKKAKYTLNGLLIGAAIGAGFAAFESAGYAFNSFLGNLFVSGTLGASYDAMIDNIFLRALLAPGGHVIWAAMSGYAVMLVKGESQLDMSFVSKKAFWKVFWIPIALHAVWDMPIVIGKSEIGALFSKIVMLLLGLVIAFILIGNSLSQIGSILEAKKDEKEKISV